jgi:GNAT superfamily N-acetyltransferase
LSQLTVRPIDPALSRELRRAVLRPKLPAGAEMPGDVRPGVVHLGAFDGPQLVSACLIYPEECPWLVGRTAWRLRSMATEPDARCSGAGSAILAAAARIVSDVGAQILWCLARDTAVGFYERNGFSSIGDLFAYGELTHLKMWRVV